ncbi:MAG: HD domain-containing protein [Proteobacteria bacterium]|nr:HD domain-containing protein [Pseudomonadota bacterium]
MNVVRELFFLSTNMLSDMLDAKDKYTEGHSERVRLFSIEIGKELNLPERDLAILSLAAKLHDIGKAKIDDRILKKPGKLSVEERSEIERHTIYAQELLGRHPVLEPVLEAIRSHHERLSGKGYPDHLKGDMIPLSARIIMVADVFDAMTSRRVYRERAYSDEETLKYLKKQSGRKFDADIVDLFLDLYDHGIIDFCRGVYMSKNDLYGSLELFRKALDKYNRPDIDRVYLMMGITLNKVWKPMEAIYFLNKGLKVNGEYRFRIRNEIAMSNYYMGNMDALYKNFLYFNENSNKISLGDKIRAYHGILVYYWKKREEKALIYIEELQSMFQSFEEQEDYSSKDDIFIYIERKRKDFDDIIYIKSKSYNIMAEIMFDLDKLPDSIKYYNYSISIKAINGDSLGRVMSLLGIARAYYEMRDFEKAEMSAVNCLIANHENKDKYGIYLSSLLLSDIYREMKNYDKALFFLIKSRELKENARKKDDYYKYYISEWLYQIEKGRGDHIIDDIKTKLSEKSYSDKVRGMFYYCLGRAKEASRKTEAVSAYKQALKIFNALRIEPFIKKVKERLSIVGRA